MLVFRGVHPQKLSKTNMTIEVTNHEWVGKYLLLKWWFSIAMLAFQGVFLVFLFPFSSSAASSRKSTGLEPPLFAVIKLSTAVSKVLPWHKWYVWIHIYIHIYIYICVCVFRKIYIYHISEYELGVWGSACCAKLFMIFVTVKCINWIQGYQKQKESTSMVDSLILCMHIYNISYMYAYIYIYILSQIYTNMTHK